MKKKLPARSLAQPLASKRKKLGKYATNCVLGRLPRVVVGLPPRLSSHDGAAVTELPPQDYKDEWIGSSTREEYRFARAKCE